MVVERTTYKHTPALFALVVIVLLALTFGVARFLIPTMLSQADTVAVMLGVASALALIYLWVFVFPPLLRRTYGHYVTVTADVKVGE